MHYIRVDVVETLILRTIKAVCGYALENETAFMEKVREKSLIEAENFCQGKQEENHQIQAAARGNRRAD